MKTYKPIVRIIADSIYEGKRITTIVVENMPDRLLKEVNTHRQGIARNAGSTRAIPSSKTLRQAWQIPYIPTPTKNQSGMQGSVIDSSEAWKFVLWRTIASRSLVLLAKVGFMLGFHKQNVNDLLAPALTIPWICTFTDLDNFLKLRLNPAAHPDLNLIAKEIKDLLDTHEPMELFEGDYHIPFYYNIVDVHGVKWGDLSMTEKIKVCVARCARISYSNFDNSVDFAKDFKLYDRLLKEGHLSPFEHVAMAYKTTARLYFKNLEAGVKDPYEPWQYGSFWDLKNMEGHWVQFRHLV